MAWQARASGPPITCSHILYTLPLVRVLLAACGAYTAHCVLQHGTHVELPPPVLVSYTQMLQQSRAAAMRRPLLRSCSCTCTAARRLPRPPCSSTRAAAPSAAVQTAVLPRRATPAALQPSTLPWWHGCKPCGRRLQGTQLRALAAVCHQHLTQQQQQPSSSSSSSRSVQCWPAAGR